METWTGRVTEYIDHLQSLVDEVDAALQAAQVDSSKLDPAVVQEATTLLEDRLETLEQQVAQRDQLLRADDAPPAGLTLIEKLQAANEPALAQRADQVAQQIGLTHQRSMSLFVCQFHLSNLTTDLVRIMTGADQPATYGGAGIVQSTPQGGLFNEAG